MISQPKIKHVEPRKPKATAQTIVRENRIVAPPEASEIPAELLEIIALTGRGFLEKTDSGWVLVPLGAYELIQSGLTSPGWIRLGRIDSATPRVLRFGLAMIRGNTGKATPSEYYLTVSANSGETAGLCCFGAQLNCVYGDDYDVTNDDPLLAVALVRRAGYGPRKADLLIKHEGAAFALEISPSDPAKCFTWDPAPGLDDPGTDDDVTIAKRHILQYA